MKIWFIAVNPEDERDFALCVVNVPAELPKWKLSKGQPVPLIADSIISGRVIDYRTWRVGSIFDTKTGHFLEALSVLELASDSQNLLRNVGEIIRKTWEARKSVEVYR